MKNNNKLLLCLAIIIGFILVVVIILYLSIIRLSNSSTTQNRVFNAVNNFEENNASFVNINENNTMVNNVKKEDLDEENEKQKALQRNAEIQHKRDCIQIAKACVNKYLDVANTESWQMADAYGNGSKILKENLYYMLSENYTSKNNITESNVINKLKIFDKNYSFILQNIKIINEEDPTCTIYYVEGIGQNIAFNSTSKLKFILYVNINEAFFKIEPAEGVPNNVSKVSISKGGNSYEYTTLENGSVEILNDYLKTIKSNFLGDIYFIYNKLDKTYLEKKFSNYNDFKEYFNEKKEEISNSTLKKYILNEYEDYTEYVLVDQYENHYVIKEYDPMNYSILLDNYIIISEKNLKEYEESDLEEKCKENLRRFIRMLNCKDYNAIYNVLDNAFKAQKFENKDSLKEFLNSNTYKNNLIHVKKYNKNENGYYVFECDLINRDNEDEDKDMIIVIKPGEGTNFTMSFSFN